ncbi:MAG: relaxase/mobilization nuclease RlxS [Pseudomonadota bacterium]
MSGEDDFEPHLGRMRNRGGGKARRYVGLVTAAAARAGLDSRGSLRRRFDGSRIGRGASMGRVLSSRGATMRRAVVKTRLIRLSSKARSAARAHLRYLQRDGVTREGEPGRLYGPETDATDGKVFLEKCGDDRHQFRIIVSAEDGDQYEDLKPFTRRLMAQVEKDLGTKLDWVAVDHFNTGHPHTHIILRGVDDRGQNLIIAREYISHGFRARAAERATADLGPRTLLEIEARQRRDVGAERLTAIDRQLVRESDGDRIVSAATRDPLQAALRAARLQRLQALGLASDIGGGRYQLADDLEATLRAAGERGDIIRTMQRELSARKLDRSHDGTMIFGASKGETEPLVGRVIARGLADEHSDRHYLLVDSVDGKPHYVDIGRGDAVEPLPEGAIVQVAARSYGIRDADRTIMTVASTNAGFYSADLHLRHDPAATQSFADAHVRRLEAVRRSTGIERRPDGSWPIGADHLKKVAIHEARQQRDRPVELEILSSAPLQTLSTANAATWLDRELAVEVPRVVRDAGFGREVGAAMAVRRQWLVDQGLVDPGARDDRLRASVIATLQRRELLRVAEGLSAELRKPFAETVAGGEVGGRLARKIDTLGGRLALVENAREFTLVPWRPVLEDHVGKQVSGLMRKGGIDWQIGRGRSGPQIS